MCLSACGPASRGADEPGHVSSIHREGHVAAFLWREASVLPGGVRVVTRTGVLRTVEVLPDGTARMGIVFTDHGIHTNGRAHDLGTDGAEIRYIAAPGGGVAGSMSILGEPIMGEPLVAALLPFARPPIAEWPEPTDEEQAVAVSIGGADGAVSYRRLPGAPQGVSWVLLDGEVRLASRSPTRVDAPPPRAVVGVLLASAGGIESSARLALGVRGGAHIGRAEVEMIVGEGVTLPEAEHGSLLACADPVRDLRVRLDESPLPPFVLNRPLEDAMLVEAAQEGAGPGVLLDLRAGGGAVPLDALFDGLDADLPDRDLAALSVRVAEHARAVERAMTITAELTGLAVPGGTDPIYLLLDAAAPAVRALALGEAVRRAVREPRLVVRRPDVGPREGGALRPSAARLAARASECPFVAGAVAELATRDLVVSPGWVRAVVAGGVGTCGCDDVVAEPLAQEALYWSHVSMQSWGWVALGARELDAGASVAEAFGSR